MICEEQIFIIGDIREIDGRENILFINFLQKIVLQLDNIMYTTVLEDNIRYDNST